ncbi:MAG: ANTAR domain-containing protein [Streptomyces sp.]|jgi:ANTAR domain/GAF domain|uniref:ANTAR domain-containing protein n=1 Tax=Streptomyces sp. TaxID=1931 RepID=UPI0025F12039|nr:ANTAR domain-containing protein [Streptomyces sp.]MBW8792744.1 ANTAR domain-containing protein [Streptomyces sp.]
MTENSGTPALRPGERGPEDPEQQAIDARNRKLARAGVARAERLLVASYRLSSDQEAFDLLRRASQRFNVKLHTLADTAVHLPAPEPGASSWVPSRPRPAAPPLPALPALRGDERRPADEGAVLKAALHRTLRITGAEMGNVQLVQNGMLRMEHHTGLNGRFTDYFTFIDTSTTSCAQAAEQTRQVTVKDVAASDTFDEVSRRTILQTGSHACHSVPLLSPRGAVIGMVSSHHDRPLLHLTAAQSAALDQLGRQVGRWLVWHRNTTVVSALNHLHTTATR